MWFADGRRATGDNGDNGDYDADRRDPVICGRGQLFICVACLRMESVASAESEKSEESAESEEALGRQRNLEYTRQQLHSMQMRRLISRRPPTPRWTPSAAAVFFAGGVQVRSFEFEFVFWASLADFEFLEFFPESPRRTRKQR